MLAAPTSLHPAANPHACGGARQRGRLSSKRSRLARAFASAQLDLPFSPRPAPLFGRRRTPGPPLRWANDSATVSTAPLMQLIARGRAGARPRTAAAHAAAAYRVGRALNNTHGEAPGGAGRTAAVPGTSFSSSTPPNLFPAPAGRTRSNAHKKRGASYCVTPPPRQRGRAPARRPQATHGGGGGARGRAPLRRPGTFICPQPHAGGLFLGPPSPLWGLLGAWAQAPQDTAFLHRPARSWPANARFPACLEPRTGG
jgi:hypothetical protein